MRAPFAKAKPIRDISEPWHPIYREQGAQAALTRAERDIQRTIVAWFEDVLQELDKEAGETKAIVPDWGVVLALLNGQKWWQFYLTQLESVLAQKLIPITKIGVHMGARQTRIMLNWELLLPGAEQWAQEHAAELVKRIDEGLRPPIHQAVMDGMQQGLAWRDVRDRIVKDTGLTEWRAARIARTEVIRAHSHGAAISYNESGVVRGVTWLDGQDGACALCRDLNGQIRRLGESFYSDRFGDGLPPRHPHCRCAIKPVTLDMIKRLPNDHPLRENRRDGIAQLTDRDTYTEIGGIRVTGEARRHWRLRHATNFDINKAEALLPQLLTQPAMVKRQPNRRGVVYVIPWGDRTYLVAPITEHKQMKTLTLKNRREVDKWD